MLDDSTNNIGFQSLPKKLAKSSYSEHFCLKKMILKHKTSIFHVTSTIWAFFFSLILIPHEIRTRKSGALLGHSSKNSIFGLFSVFLGSATVNDDQAFSKCRFFLGKCILPFHGGYQGEFGSVEKSPEVLLFVCWQPFPQ